MWLVGWLAPQARIDFAARRPLAGAIAAAGVVIVTLAVARFLRARTTVSPTHPESASALVTSGIYRVTRNPMYLGLLLLLAAWAVLLAHPAPPVLLPAFVVCMNRLQIAPEESALEQHFGAKYIDYKRCVRRWL